MGKRAEASARVAEALERLAGLGGPHEIADHLRAASITGDHEADSDPVANWVTAQTGSPVSINMMEWTSGGPRRPTPQEVAEFIYYFDRGRYPDLDSTGRSSNYQL